MVAELSSQNKIALLIASGIFIVFALASSFLFPRLRGDFPGRRLGTFIALSFLLFAGMLGSVYVFGKESEEAHAQEEVETGPVHGGEAGTTAPPTTNAGESVSPLQVTETEWKVALPQKTLRAGSYDITLKNAGKAPHNLVITGENVDNASTAVIGGGKTAKIQVALTPGEYKFYCSVPGHEDLGMKTTVRVS